MLYFLYGLAFEGLGLAAYLQLRREGDFPLKRELPWLGAFGFVGGAAGWVDMFITSGSLDEIANVMRHRSRSTTMTYAKLDIEGLRSLALPWPSKGVVK